MPRLLFKRHYPTDLPPKTTPVVIPAKAGIQFVDSLFLTEYELDFHFCGNDWWYGTPEMYK
jgi:hypothetical protein